MKQSRRIALTGMLSAMYAVTVVVFAPISFGPIQFRAANLLKALALCRPEFALAFAVGNFIANQTSPFGPLDWAVMPVFDWLGAILAYRLRTQPLCAILIQSSVIAIGVATFPLGLGAGLPWMPAFAGVFLSSVVAIGSGFIVLVPAWRRIDAELHYD